MIGGQACPDGQQSREPAVLPLNDSEGSLVKSEEQLLNNSKESRRAGSKE